jgi:hypothetical protein
MSEETQQSSPPVLLEGMPLSEHGQRRRRRRSRSRIQKWVTKIKRTVRFRALFTFVLFVTVITVLTLSVLIVDANAKFNTSWQSMNRILQSIDSRQGTDLTLTDFTRIRLGVTDLRQQIDTTRSRIRLLSPIVSLNNDWQGSVQLLDVSKLIVSSTEDILDGIEPAINFLVQGEDDQAIASQISSGERVVELLELGQGRFLKASETLVMAGQQLDNIDLTAISSDLLLNLTQIQSFHVQLTTMNDVLMASPDILSQVMGIDEEVAYLILAQNNDEIRPSGGYISTYGWLTVRNGRVTDYDYSPTTATSPRPPNESFVDTFEIPDWWIDFGNPIYAAWDGSWYADFPSTAELALNYYNEGQNPNFPVDGIIAIDITGFELILGSLGDVIVPDYNRVVNVKNFRDVVYDIRTYGDSEHKRFLAAVYQAIFADWQSVEQDSSSGLLTAMLEAVTQRHIMIYIPDEGTQNVVDLLGWAGSQNRPEANDYILVADSNLGNKSNYSVIRSLTYDVTIEPDQSRMSNLRVRYDYFDSIAQDDPAVDSEFHGPRDYKTLTQIYVPEEVNFLDDDNFDQVSVQEWDDYTLIVSRVDVDYDTSERLQLSYEMPATEDRVGDFYRYRLLIQKQPGSRIQDVNLQITLPEGAEIISLSPEADANYALERPILDFRLQLVSDQWIEVIYSLKPS